MSEFKVSVLIPVYNVSSYIERCAHSIFSQTLKEIEFIFVDDCSPDDSIEKLKNILDFYPERTDAVKIIRHLKNSGISVARQTAFDAASGDYLLAMDSDDYIEPEMVKLLYNKAIETDADLVYCDYFSEFSTNKTVICHANFTDNKLKLLDWAIQGHSSYWNKLIARRIFTENNIRTLEGIDHGDDLSVIAKVIYHSQNFAYLPQPLYHYIQYNVNSTTKKFKPKYIEDRLKLVADLDSFFKSKSDYSLFEPSVWLLKGLRKLRLLRLTKGQSTYMDLYADINSHIGQLDLPLKSKLILWLAAKRNKFVLKLVMSVIIILSK
jgi:glycosyltransferase involved in cell wall biosynthesis